MKVPAIIALIAVAVLLAGMIRLKAQAEYSEDGFFIKLRLLFFAFTLFPFPERLKSAKKPKKREKEKPGKEKKGGRLKTVKELLPVLCDTVKRFRRRIVIDSLVVRYYAASDDPFTTAMMFGGASAGAGFLVPALENLFKIKKREISTGFSFEEEEPRVYIRAEASITIWEILFIIILSLSGIIKSGALGAKGKNDVSRMKN